MNREGRNPPDWFGGGQNFVPSSVAVSIDADKKRDKKKHRRSKSDISHQNSQSRKATERKEKLKTKDHRRSRNASIPGGNDNTAQSFGGTSDSLIDLFHQQQQRYYASISSTDAMPSNKPEIQKRKQKHKRNYTIPPTEKKKSGNFFERIFGHGKPEQSRQTPTNKSVHIDVHQVEEKFDPEEGRARKPSESMNQQSTQTVNNKQTLVYSHIGSSPINDRKKRQLQPEYSYQQPISTNALESDDLLSYSDDDTFLSNLTPGPQPYPAYLSDEDMQNHESFQIMQQKRLTHLSQSKTNFTNSHKNNMKKYGAINHPAGLPTPIKQRQQVDKRSSSNSLDWYLSEDDTLTSFHTQETFRNVDNFFFGRIRPDDKTQLSTPHSEKEVDGEYKSLLSPTQAKLHTESRFLGNNQEEESDVTNHACNTTFSHSSHLGSDGSEGRSPLITPNSQSYGSYNGTNIKRKGSKGSSPPTSNLEIQQSSLKASSPSPPMSSVKIVKTTEMGAATVRSHSSTSPHYASISMAASSSSSKTRDKSRTSRKESSRVRKKMKKKQKEEEYVQYLLRDVHENWRTQHPDDQSVGRISSNFLQTYGGKAQDVTFAFLFLFQLATVIFLATKYAGETILRNDDNNDPEINPYLVDNDDPFSSGSFYPDENASPISTWTKDIYVDYANAIQLSCIAALYATVLSALAIGMMMILSAAFIPTVLCVTVVTCIVAGSIMMALSPYTVMPVLALAALAISLAYSIVVWDRISFATTNLHTALVGIKSSADVLMVGFAMMVVAFAWTITWMVALLGIYDNYLDNNDHELTSNTTWEGLSVCLGMLTSYIWTFHVIMNIVHVSVAGAISSWWTSSDSLSSCCSNAFREHFLACVTKSFGSICLGSLVVPPLRMLRFILLFVCPQTIAKSNTIPIAVADSSQGPMMGDRSVKSDVSIASVYPDVSFPLDRLMRYFNDFGFTYVGIYRRNFIYSSEKATAVFKARGWLGIANDRLIPHVLKLVSLLITLGSGFFGLLVEEYDGYSFTNFRKPTSTAFIIGCFVGFVLSSVCLKIIESAVNAVLVCFSIHPYTFKYYHPMLSNEMRSSWGGVWIDETPV